MDAGDFVKFTHTTAYASTMLLAAARALGRGTAAHARAEARFGLNWLAKAWDEKTGVLYIQVGIGSGNKTGTFFGDHDVWRLPEKDDGLEGRAKPLPPQPAGVPRQRARRRRSRRTSRAGSRPPSRSPRSSTPRPSPSAPARSSPPPRRSSPPRRRRREGTSPPRSRTRSIPSPHGATTSSSAPPSSRSPARRSATRAPATGSTSRGLGARLSRPRGRRRRRSTSTTPARSPTPS